MIAGTEGYWGGNSPVNLARDSLSGSRFDLNTHDLKGGIVPVFDIVGSRQEFDNSLVPSPLDCFDNNFLLTREHRFYTTQVGRDAIEETTCRSYMSVPMPGQSTERWTCATTNTRLDSTDGFGDHYASISDSGAGACILDVLNLDGEVIKQSATSPVCS